LSGAAKAGELVACDQADDQGEATGEVSGPFFRGDLPFTTEIKNATSGGETEADLDIFHEGLGGESAGCFEGGAANEHGLVPEGDTAEDDPGFV